MKVTKRSRSPLRHAYETLVLVAYAAVGVALPMVVELIRGRKS